MLTRLRLPLLLFAAFTILLPLSSASAQDSTRSERRRSSGVEGSRESRESRGSRVQTGRTQTSRGARATRREEGESARDGASLQNGERSRNTERARGADRSRDTRSVDDTRDTSARERSSDRARNTDSARGADRSRDVTVPDRSSDRSREVDVRDRRRDEDGRDRDRRQDDNRYDRDRRQDGDRYDDDRRHDDDWDRRHDDGRRHGGQHYGGPRIRIDVGWPWVHRHQRHWSPRYRFRQIVHIDAGWRGHHRDSRIDVRTYYRHRVRDASSRRAEVDVYIDRIELYDSGHFIGEVHHIPDDLAHMRAIVRRDGAIDFDRSIFLVGDPYVGFEIISTRHYGGFLLNRYRRSHGFRVGVPNFRRDRVDQVRRSRFFDPLEFSGFVPISLLPEDGEWLADYGFRSPSRQWYGDDDDFYYGWSDLNDYDRFDDDRTLYNRREGSSDGTYSSRALPNAAPLQDRREESFTTEDGAEIKLKRETTLERLD